MRGLWYFVPPAAWMAVIFVFSTSLFAGSETGKVFEPIVLFFYPQASGELVDTLHNLVRKAGHLTEYMVLALLWHRALVKGAGCARGKALLLSFAVSAFYAATDEFHQAFVPDRTPSAMDVLVDAAGAALCTAFIGLKTKMRGPSQGCAKCIKT